jgi:hypothetical protein
MVSRGHHIGAHDVDVRHPRLRSLPSEGGLPSEQADTHAKAATQIIVTDLATKEDLANGLENMGLRLSVRFGIMLAAGLSLMTAILAR